MDSTFRDMIAEGWLVIYMDDVLVFAENLEECQERTKRVLDRMKEVLCVAYKKTPRDFCH